MQFLYEDLSTFYLIEICPFLKFRGESHFEARVHQYQIISQYKHRNCKFFFVQLGRNVNFFINSALCFHHMAVQISLNEDLILTAEWLNQSIHVFPLCCFVILSTCYILRMHVRLLITLKITIFLPSKNKSIASSLNSVYWLFDFLSISIIFLAYIPKLISLVS